MEAFRITGGHQITGEVRVRSAKNAVLPILAASILTAEEVTLLGCPDILDVRSMVEILRCLGCTAKWEENSITLKSDALSEYALPCALSKQIRSSIFLLGPVLSRQRRATVTYPGGCEIGLRPIDLHLQGLKTLGVRIEDEGGILHCDGREMHAGDVYFDYPSVGATENVMMAAVLLPGITTIHNAAREPEIEDLQNFICALGGCVTGAGTQLIRIEGTQKLHGATYCPIPDRIVAGTLLAAAAITGGNLMCYGARNRDLVPVVAKLTEMGCHLEDHPAEGIRLTAPKRLTAFHSLQTQPYPGFPTDMQSQMLSLCCVANGTSVITENVFENRFAHAGDLCAMGGDIRVNGKLAVIQGVEKLHGARVTARDLRGGAALVLAALAAEGESVIENVSLVDRGYEHLEETLSGAGALIRRFCVS